MRRSALNDEKFLLIVIITKKLEKDVMLVLVHGEKGAIRQGNLLLNELMGAMIKIVNIPDIQELPPYIYEEAKKLDIKIGEILSIDLPLGTSNKKVSAIYSDYGNPKIQLMIPIDTFRINYPKLKPTTYAVRIEKEKINSFISAAKLKFPFDGSWITDQNAVKITSLRIFDRTFSITNSLSILTLIIAGLAVFSTLATIGETRRSQLAPAWAMGITKLSLSFHEFLRSLILAVTSIIFSGSSSLVSSLDSISSIIGSLRGFFNASFIS